MCPGDVLADLGTKHGLAIDPIIVSLLNRWGTAATRRRAAWLVKRLGDASLVNEMLEKSSEDCLETQIRVPRGLGDTVATITKAVGIKPCAGCEERRERWNRAVPYKTS